MLVRGGSLNTTTVELKPEDIRSEWVLSRALYAYREREREREREMYGYKLL